MIEKAPLFALAVASSLVTFLVQSAGGSVVSLESRPFGQRLANATVSYVAYIRQTLWPTDLACFYPRVLDLGAGQVAGAALLLVAVTAGVFFLARRRRSLAVGWLWYLGTLVPVIGLVQFGDQARADRFTYLPLVGLFILITFGAREALEHRTAKRLLGMLGLVALAACAVITWRQVSVWRNSETLFTHALAVTSRNHVAHLNLGGALREAGRLEEARTHFLAVLDLLPGDVHARNDLGVVLQLEGRVDEAIAHYRAALSAAPDYPDAHYNLANALAAQGHLDAAQEEYARAIALESGFRGGAQQPRQPALEARRPGRRHRRVRARPRHQAGIPERPHQSRDAHTSDAGMSRGRLRSTKKRSSSDPRPSRHTTTSATPSLRRAGSATPSSITRRRCGSSRTTRKPTTTGAPPSPSRRDSKRRRSTSRRRSGSSRTTPTPGKAWRAHAPRSLLRRSRSARRLAPRPRLPAPGGAHQKRRSPGRPHGPRGFVGMRRAATGVAARHTFRRLRRAWIRNRTSVGADAAGRLPAARAARDRHCNLTAVDDL